MGLGKKLATLINATIRSGLPQRRRPSLKVDDPDKQLKAVREALAMVELQEREVVNQLQQTEANVETAIAQGNQEEVANQQRLARELEAQLQTQSTEATALAEQLATLETVLIEQRAEAEEAMHQAQVNLDQPETVQADHDADNNDSHDQELSDRKSRLSG